MSVRSLFPAFFVSFLQFLHLSFFLSTFFIIFFHLFLFSFQSPSCFIVLSLLLSPFRCPCLYPSAHSRSCNTPPPQKKKHAHRLPRRLFLKLPRTCVTERSDDTWTWPTLISFDKTKLSKCALSQLWWPHNDIYLCAPLQWPRAHSCCRHTGLWNPRLF